MNRKQLAQETLDILARGGYQGPGGWVEIAGQIGRAHV